MELPVVSPVEWTDAIPFSASPSDVRRALLSLEGISSVSVAGSIHNYVIVFDIPSHGGVEIVPLIPLIEGLKGRTPDIRVTEQQRGMVGVFHPVFNVKVIGATGGSFRLGYQTITSPITEASIAMTWVYESLRNNTTIKNLIQPWNLSYIAVDRLPVTGMNVLDGGTVEMVPTLWQTGIVYSLVNSSDLTPHVGGLRSSSTVFVSIEMQAKTGRYDQRLQAGAIVIDSLFNEVRERVISVDGVTYGIVRASDRVSEINTSTMDKDGRETFGKGGIFEIDVEKG
jgi:hypothetical protein